MNRASFFSADLWICLPFLALVGLAIALARDALPKLEAAEQARLTAEYRECARSIMEGEMPSKELIADGYKAKGRLGTGSWGFAPKAGKVEVWYRKTRQKTVASALVEAVPRTNYRMYFGVGGGLLLVTMVAIMDVGLRQFRRFAQEKDDFIAAAAHDLKTPVAALQLLVGRDDEMAKLVVQRMRHIVTNLISYLNLGGKAPKVRNEKFDLVKAFDEAYALYREDFEELSAAIAREGSATVNVMGDYDATVQVLWNLLGNELKYAAPYGKVQVAFEEDAQDARLLISDTGKGMSRGEMRKAFVRGYRAKSALGGGMGGLGIGLYSARKLARAMGGDLSVKANMPRGCVFTLRLNRPIDEGNG